MFKTTQTPQLRAAAGIRHDTGNFCGTWRLLAEHRPLWARPLCAVPVLLALVLGGESAQAQWATVTNGNVNIQGTLDLNSPSGTNTLTGISAGAVTATSTDAINGAQFHSLSTGLSTVNSNVDGISAWLSTTNTGLSTLSTSTSTSLSTVNNSIDGISAWLSTTNSNLSTLSTTASTGLSTTNSNVAGLSTSTSTGLSTVNSRVDNLSTGLASTNTNLSTLSTSTSTSLSTTNSNVASLSTSTSTGLSTVNSSISSLSTGLSSTNSTVSALSTTVSTVYNNNKYFNASANDTGAAAQATGSGSLAAGAGSVAQGTRSVAVGEGAQATAAQATAIGSRAVASAANSVALGADSVALEENTVSIGSAGQERRLTNLGEGVNGTDAANMNQLNRVAAGMNQKIHSVERNANAGIAAALAASSLPQPTQAGKSMVMAGAGYYSGESAVAVGVSKISENGNWVVKASTSVNTRSKPTAGAGVGFQW